MKTKKIKQLSLIYLVSVVVIFTISLWLSVHFVHLLWWIWGSSLCIAFALLYYMVRDATKYLLFVNFEKYLQLRIYKKWPAKTEFPLQEDIQKWIHNYHESVEGFFAKPIWDKVMRVPNVHIDDILKRLVVPVIGVEKGLSLYDIYSSPTINTLEVNAGNTTKESQEMGAYIEYLPAGDLIACLGMPMQLTGPVLHRLFIRKNEVGNFATVCQKLMEAKCEIWFSNEVIDILIAETQREVPIVFPKEFLAYLIKVDPANTEKRKKVFDWYCSQKKQDIDREFFFVWPTPTAEEIQVIFKIFDEKSIRDEICRVHKLWKYASVDVLIGKIYADYETVEDDFIDQVVKRLRK